VQQARSSKHSDGRRVYLIVQHSFNSSSCSPGRDRLQIHRSIQLSGRSISRQGITVRGGPRGCPDHVRLDSAHVHRSSSYWYPCAPETRILSLADRRLKVLADAGLVQVATGQREFQSLRSVRAISSFELSFSFFPRVWLRWPRRSSRAKLFFFEAEPQTCVHFPLLKII
jgi:hypothetical protein